MKIINNRYVIFIVLLNMSFLYGMHLETFPDEIIIKCAFFLIKEEAPADVNHYQCNTADTKNMDQVIDNYMQSDYKNFRRTCRHMHDVLLPPDVDLSNFLFNSLFKFGWFRNRNSKGSNYFPEELRKNDMKVILLNSHGSFYHGSYVLYLYCIDKNLYWFLDVYARTNNENITCEQVSITSLEAMVKKFKFVGAFLLNELENLKKYIKKDNLTLISGMNVLSIYTDITVDWNNIRQLLWAFKNYKNK